MGRAAVPFVLFHKMAWTTRANKLSHIRSWIKPNSGVFSLNGKPGGVWLRENGSGKKGDVVGPVLFFCFGFCAGSGKYGEIVGFLVRSDLLGRSSLTSGELFLLF